MCKDYFGLLFVLFFLAFYSGNGLTQVTQSESLNSEKQKQEELLNRLEQLNTKLSSELQNSNSNLTLLKSQLQSLQIELVASKESLNRLFNQLTISEQELAMLRATLKRAEESLSNLEQAFDKYKQEAEKQISHYKGQRNFIAVIGTILLTLALVF